MQKIYVLRCKNNKYYVGKTSDIDRRFAQHFSGQYGSEWTRRYGPEEVVEVKNMTSDYDEMNKTLEYMKKYGIEHVRGAQWSNINLTEEQRSFIIKAINPNACFRCQQNGHFSENCPHRNQSYRTPETMQCFRCGQHGHFANECNNNYHTMFCERCGRDSHSEDRCHATIDIDGNMLNCTRCGRDSHSANVCRARTDIDGQRLY
jgi:predicted GIY-YIG superfamily endonuclease